MAGNVVLTDGERTAAWILSAATHMSFSLSGKRAPGEDYSPQIWGRMQWDLQCRSGST